MSADKKRNSFVAWIVRWVSIVKRLTVLVVLGIVLYLFRMLPYSLRQKLDRFQKELGWRQTQKELRKKKEKL